MSVKQINVKLAEKWLEKLKTQSPQAYNKIVKSLRNYENTDDQYHCYITISRELLPHRQLTTELNDYMEETNKFVINKPYDQKIKEFISSVKQIRPEAFQKIIQLIQDLSKTRGENTQEISKVLRPKLKEIVHGDTKLQHITEVALNLTAEELIKRKNLNHLKAPKVTNMNAEQQREANRQPQINHTTERQRRNNQSGLQLYGRQPGGRANRPMVIGPFTNSSEERSLIHQIQRMVDQRTYNYIIRIVNIYYLNIITLNEAYEMLAGVQLDQQYLESLKMILDSRENERRKASCFKPLGDINFTDIQRASPSYVAMPPYYPIRSSRKTDQIRVLTNEKWVSVPQGSEGSQNFSVRNKNPNEINLLKSEDQRYQFDLFMLRLKKTLDFLDEIIDEKNGKNYQIRQKNIKKALEMGTLQILYRNGPKELKQQLQCFLRIADIQTCKIFRQRVIAEINELKNIKEVHATKNWTEVAIKNFYKALDIKEFEFKKNQKEKMKTTYFISELLQKEKLLQNGGQSKSNIIFEEKKDFFTVLNSFQCSSRTQKCNNRNLPQIQAFDLKDEKNRHLYPLIILSFEDKSVCQSLCSLLLFYIEVPSKQGQKNRYKFFLERFLANFLGWKLPPREYLNDNFDQLKFYQKINGSEEMINTKQWVSEADEQILSMIDEKDEEYKKEKEQKKKMGFLRDQISKYSYLPVKNEEKSVLYGPESLYAFVRFLYAAYQRLIKLREVAQSTQKIELFKILFYACLKTKQSSKFQENLNLLFGKQAYLFSTLYKLFENLVKSLDNLSNCELMKYSLKVYNQESQDLYLLLMNRFCLNSGLNNAKMVRLTFNSQSKAVYFNYLHSYYKSDQVGKDMIKKRAEIANAIDMYTNDNIELQAKKRRKPSQQVYFNNEIQYIFQGSTIRMLNHRQNEDLLVCMGRKGTNTKQATKRELKRSFRLSQKIN